jgi:hypothetical protein
VHSTWRQPIYAVPTSLLRQKTGMAPSATTRSLNLHLEAILRQSKVMAKDITKIVGKKNGLTPKPPLTPLGKELRKLREKYIASGGKLLNRRELEREVAERRGSR